MPRRPKKDKSSKEKEIEIKNKLDSIVLADEMLEGLSTPDIPPIKESRVLNINNIKSEVEVEARSILEALSNFYNEADGLPDDHYMKKRQKIDSLNISTMAFQIRAAQHAISKIIEEIDAGRVDTGLFQVLAQLQNQIMQMPKNFTSYMSEMEKAYKGLKKEDEEMKKGPSIEFNEDGVMQQTEENLEKLKVRGTKSLMENMQSLLKSQKIKDAEIISEPQNDLINPKSTESTKDEYGGSLENEEEDFEIDDELFD
jgi:hypothetical protein